MALRIVEPFLRARGIGRLDVVALSHPHPDHLNGLFRVLERFDAAVGQRTEWLDGDLAELGRGDDRRRDVSGFGERDESAVLRVSPVVAARPKGTHVEPLQHSNRPFR